MKYNEYLEQRQALMNELQTLIDSGASDEEYNAKKAEVEALDEKWEAICQRQADREKRSGTSIGSAPDLTDRSA